MKNSITAAAEKELADRGLGLAWLYKKLEGEGAGEMYAQKWNTWKSRGVPKKNLVHLAAVFGWDLPALNNGIVQRAPSEIDVGSDLTIAQYDAGGGMGVGRLMLEDGQPGIIKSWRVDNEWLRLNVRHYTSTANLCIVTGFGPSMRPRYNPGDPLLMDRGITTVETDGVYFFRVDDCGYIKQLQRIPGERGTVYRAKSYNPDYEPFDITKKMDFEVFGKILTIWKSEQV